ncbi:DUF2500 domain-containing protein [Cytobacillus suaedae]|nr:DUF2500 domain-containing protein [Cytobacillus suaedae]
MSAFGTIIFLIVIGGFIYVIGKGLMTWSSNNAATPVSTFAKVLSKRTQVYGGSGESRARTAYFITFELGSGERVELQVKPKDSGLIVEGDKGTLMYQGTRFNGFSRKVTNNE